MPGRDIPLYRPCGDPALIPDNSGDEGFTPAPVQASPPVLIDLSAIRLEPLVIPDGDKPVYYVNTEQSYTASCPGGPGPDALSFDVYLTVGAGTVGSDLVGFPLMIRLSDLPAGLWDDLSAGGGNLRAFLDDESETQIPLDILWVDSFSQDGVVFVRVDISSLEDTTIILRVQFDAPTLAPADPYGRHEVWSAYECVYAFRGDLVDRTGKNTLAMLAGTDSYDLTSLGAMGLGGGLVGNGVNLAEGSVSTPGSPVFTIAVTMEANSQAFSQFPFVFYRLGMVGQRALCYPSSDTLTYVGYDGVNEVFASAVPRDLNTPHRLVGTWDGTAARKFYIDAGLTTDSSITAVGSLNDTVRFFNDTGGLIMSGTVGFAYLRYSVLSEDWVGAEYANISDPSSFYSVSLGS